MSGLLCLVSETEREFISARNTEALAKRKVAGLLLLGRPKGGLCAEKKLDTRKEEISELLTQDQYCAYCRLFANAPLRLDGKQRPVPIHQERQTAEG